MIEYTKQLPVRHQMDVFVAGGGPAGVAAALAAARQGASVLLIEGTACFAGVHAVCRWHQLFGRRYRPRDL